jgi:hypothetical protein
MGRPGFGWVGTGGNEVRNTELGHPTAPNREEEPVPRTKKYGFLFLDYRCLPPKFQKTLNN